MNIQELLNRDTGSYVQLYFALKYPTLLMSPSFTLPFGDPFVVFVAADVQNVDEKLVIRNRISD